jgi:hypothetical protein
MTIGSYESVIFQHRTLNLCFAMWADNNIVKTSSNFHLAKVLDVGLGMLRRRRVDGVREQEYTAMFLVQSSRRTTATHSILLTKGTERRVSMIWAAKRKVTIGRRS